MLPKELTDEEKAELEAAKTKKGAPPKDDKKKKGQEEEISQEEKDRIERENAEKQAEVERRKQEWENLADAVKFFRVNEDPYKEACIKFQPAEGEEEAKAEVVKQGNAILDFENDVNDNKGCWLFFEKLPPPEDEDPKKAKTQAKGKGPAEELKPVYGCAWVDLTLFQYEGQMIMEGRFPLKTVQGPGKTEQVEEAEN